VVPNWPLLQRSRELTWDGCLNVRDLGGHQTEDGLETRFGAIVRADSVRQLTDAGWEALADDGVTTIVDLRLRSELAEDPPRDVGIEVVHLPVMPELDSQHWVEIDAIGDAAPDYAAATEAVYLEFLARFHENFVRAVLAIAHAGEGVVVVHCQGGKDRTGLVVALLLRVAGVSIEDIAADYALSGDNLHDNSLKWIAEAEDEAERARRKRIVVSPAEAMVGVLTEIERRHGSVSDYLTAGGATDEDLELVRARLL
jgi:protein-tyrosine phosphatase